jgi:hypothetical protein
LSSDMPEFRELGDAVVLPRKPRVSENGPEHIVWKFDGFYLGGPGMRRAKAILGQHEVELAWVRRGQDTNRTHQTIDNFQVAVTGRIFVNPLDLSSLAWTEGESHLHMSGVTP